MNYHKLILPVLLLSSVHVFGDAGAGGFEPEPEGAMASDSLMRRAYKAIPVLTKQEYDRLGDFGGITRLDVLKYEELMQSHDNNATEAFVIALIGGNCSYHLARHFIVYGHVDVNADLAGQFKLIQHAVGFPGNEHAIVALLEAGADVNVSNYMGRTALHCASSFGNEDYVRVLLGAGADVNARDINGNTILHDASEAGHEGIVRILLAAGADVNARNCYGYSALDYCLRLRHKMDPEAIDVLLAAGAEINAKNVEEWILLSVAKKYGFRKALQLTRGAGLGVSFLEGCLIGGLGIYFVNHPDKLEKYFAKAKQVADCAHGAAIGGSHAALAVLAVIKQRATSLLWSLPGL